MTDTSRRTVTPAPFGTTELPAVRRAGWLLIAAFASFVGAVAVMIGLLQDFNTAVEDAAAARSVEINDLDATMLAPIYHAEYPMWRALVLFAAIVAALCVFVVAVRAVTRVRTPGGRLATIAVAAASAMPFAWAGIFVVERGLAGDDPAAWSGAYDALYLPFIAAGAAFGSVAVVAVALLLRRMDVGRRTGLVVIALSVLVIIVAPVLGVPPILPLLLGAVLGIVMLTTARSVTELR